MRSKEHPIYNTHTRALRAKRTAARACTRNTRKGEYRLVKCMGTSQEAHSTRSLTRRRRANCARPQRNGTRHAASAKVAFLFHHSTLYCIVLCSIVCPPVRRPGARTRRSSGARFRIGSCLEPTRRYTRCGFCARTRELLGRCVMMRACVRMLLLERCVFDCAHGRAELFRIHVHTHFGRVWFSRRSARERKEPSENCECSYGDSTIHNDGIPMTSARVKMEVKTARTHTQVTRRT